MGVHEGRGQLSRAIKDLLLRWSEAKGSWDDAVSKNFEESFLAPLEIDLGAAAAAMDQAGQILHQVRRDCE